MPNIGKRNKSVMRMQSNKNGHHLFAEWLYLIFVHDHGVRFRGSSLLPRRTAVITTIPKVSRADEGENSFGVEISWSRNSTQRMVDWIRGSDHNTVTPATATSSHLGPRFRTGCCEKNYNSCMMDCLAPQGRRIILEAICRKTFTSVFTPGVSSIRCAR